MKFRRNFTLKLAIILVAFFCAYGLRQALDLTLKASSNTNYIRLLLGGPKVPPTDRGNQESSLFLDVILSIIHNYYVDQDRVTPKELAMGAISALSQSKQIDLQSNPDTNNIVFQFNNERFELALSKDPTFEEVSQFFQSLEKIALKNNVSINNKIPRDSSASFTSRLIDSLLKSLDAHSSILSSEAYLELRQGTEGSFGGLGVLVGIRNEILTVLKPIPGSPASKAGIQKNDRILSINGISTFGKSLDSLVEHMRGEPGSVVRLLLLRSGARAPADVKLHREIVQVDSIDKHEVDIKGNKVLHITVENFATRTSREIRQAIKTFRNKNRGLIPGVVLDLRGNPGGLLDQAVEVADIFLPSGVIVSTKGRREEVETAISDHDETGFPLVILIDEDSASASEIVAGALQDQGRAVVIGQPSFGKGSVQTIFELPDERALKLTIARYFTPSGKSIQNIGISPDIWIQPLIASDQNLNLLGSQRYRNERFLRHRLDVNEDEVLPLKRGQRKAYYLTQMRDREEDSSRGSVNDKELNLALKVIEKVHNTYGSKLPSSASRASHWLALSGPEVTKRLDAMDLEVVRWLEEKHKLSWQKSSSIPVKPNITFNIDESLPGETDIDAIFPIKWQIKNNEKLPIHRISVFIRSDDSDFDTQEILVGTIPPGEKIQGSIGAPILASVKASSMTLSLGIVVDGAPLPHLHAEHLIQIRDKPLADLKANLDLAEEKGGSLEGILERGEKAKLRLLVTNDGDAPAANLKLDMVNLAGKQLDLKFFSQKNFDLRPGATIALPININMAQMIDSTEISLGICIDGKNLKAPLRQRFTFRSHPSRKISAEKSSLLGH